MVEGRGTSGDGRRLVLEAAGVRPREARSPSHLGCIVVSYPSCSTSCTVSAKDWCTAEGSLGSCSRPPAVYKRVLAITPVDARNGTSTILYRGAVGVQLGGSAVGVLLAGGAICVWLAGCAIVVWLTGGAVGILLVGSVVVLLAWGDVVIRLAWGDVVILLAWGDVVLLAWGAVIVLLLRGAGAVEPCTRANCEDCVPSSGSWILSVLL